MPTLPALAFPERKQCTLVIVISCSTSIFKGQWRGENGTILTLDLKTQDGKSKGSAQSGTIQNPFSRF